MATRKKLNSIESQPETENFELGQEKKTRKRQVAKTKSKLDPVAQSKIDEQLQFLRNKELQLTAKKQSLYDDRILQETFPFWDDENRGVPNPFIRSGLFSVKTNKIREFIDGIKIASLSNYEVTYTGKELQQDDLSVWLSLINLARQRPMSDRIIFTGYALIKDLGWRMHSESYAKAQESIARLKVTGIQITDERREKGYSGSLIREYAWEHMDDDGNAKWMVRFEPRISTLFMEDTTTLFDWETRKKIGTRATVALWLHTFYSSHRNPIPLPVAKLHEMCRSESPLSSFRRNLKIALEKLREVGFLIDYQIINDVVTVVKARVRIQKPNES